MMKKHIYDESNGLSYTLHGDYYLPDLAGNSLHAVCNLIHCFHHKCAFSSSYLSIPLFFILFFLRC